VTTFLAGGGQSPNDGVGSQVGFWYLRQVMVNKKTTKGLVAGNQAVFILDGDETCSGDVQPAHELLVPGNKVSFKARTTDGRMIVDYGVYGTNAMNRPFLLEERLVEQILVWWNFRLLHLAADEAWTAVDAWNGESTAKSLRTVASETLFADVCGPAYGTIKFMLMRTVDASVSSPQYVHDRLQTYVDYKYCSSYEIITGVAPA